MGMSNQAEEVELLDQRFAAETQQLSSSSLQKERER